MTNLVQFLVEHVQALLIGVAIIVVLLTVLNPAVMLQGLSTGMGVILAQEIWASFRKYREKITKNVIDGINGVENKL